MKFYDPPRFTLTKYAAQREEAPRPAGPRIDPLTRSANRMVLDFLRDAGRRVHVREVSKLLQGDRQTADMARACCVLLALSDLRLVLVHDFDFYSAAPWEDSR